MIPPSIDVDVTTEYVVEQSDPAEERYVFAYTIVISHRSGDRCQLLNRFWRITDGGGNVEEVRGPGVVGHQPEFVQGESFKYTSGAVLKTPVGSMEGAYEFVDGDGRTFDVPIAPFALRVPNLVH